jgi:hypothetical protein
MAGELTAARRPVRAATVTLAAVGLLAVTAAAATVTVAVGRPDHSRAVAAAPSASPEAPASSAPVPLPSLSLAPSPGSTLHGTVNGDSHGGDLRYFLVPVPDGGDPYGSADGAALTMDDLAEHYSEGTGIKDVLDSYGYQEGVFRQYRTADGKEEVASRLMRFSSRDNAQQFARNATYSGGTPVDVDGDGDARGYVLKPDQQAYRGQLIGVSYVGDVEYEVTVYVKGDPDKALLSDAMKRQRDRLSSGG